MSQNGPEFEIRVKGHTLVKVSDGGVRIDGKNFHSDLKDLTDLIDILSEVVGQAQQAGKPRLVSAVKEAVPEKPAEPFPYKVISNA